MDVGSCRRPEGVSPRTGRIQGLSGPAESVAEGIPKRNQIRDQMYRTLIIIVLFASLLIGAACTPNDSPGHEDIERARESYSQGLYLESEKDYERYLQVEPQGEFRREAWDKLSVIAVEIKGDYDRAVVLLEAMYLELGTDPDDAWRIMDQLGDVYAQLGNRAKAIESFDKCLMHAIDSPQNTYTTQLRMRSCIGPWAIMNWWLRRWRTVRTRPLIMNLRQNVYINWRRAIALFPIGNSRKGRWKRCCRLMT